MWSPKVAMNVVVGVLVVVMQCMVSGSGRWASGCVFGGPGGSSVAGGVVASWFVWWFRRRCRKRWTTRPRECRRAGRRWRGCREHGARRPRIRIVSGQPVRCRGVGRACPARWIMGPAVSVSVWMHAVARGGVGEELVMVVVPSSILHALSTPGSTVGHRSWYRGVQGTAAAWRSMRLRS